MSNFNGIHHRRFISNNEIEQEIQRIMNLFPQDQKWIIETKYAPDYDDDGHYSKPSSNTEEKNTETVIRGIVSTLIFRIIQNSIKLGRRHYEKPDTQYVIEKFQDVIYYLQREIVNQNDFIKEFNNQFGDLEYQSSKISTKEQYTEKLRIQKRRSLEQAAAAFVRQHQLEGIDTFEAMEILHKKINYENSKREHYFSDEWRIERYAMSDCKHIFWQDEDYSRDQFDNNTQKLYDILCYVRDYFPLFWAEYQNNAQDERDM
jgi:hypothetical protein